MISTERQVLPFFHVLLINKNVLVLDSAPTMCTELYVNQIELNSFKLPIHTDRRTDGLCNCTAYAWTLTQRMYRM